MKPHLAKLLLPVLLAAAPASASDITLLTPEDVEWEQTPEGVAFAKLEGDRFTGAYQALVELPSGTVSPLHRKSANMFGIIVQGQMVHYDSVSDANDAKVVGPGAFYTIPAGMPHISACVSDVPCITYLYQDGAFDFVPVAQ